MNKKALVLGAGIQGILVAMQLAKKGYEVKILDKSCKALNRASRFNEGKIHLGLIWANDRSFETANYILDSAMAFAPVIEELVGEKAPWQNWLSTPFDYVCMQDSMLNKEELQTFYDKLESKYQQDYFANANYLGTRPDWLIRPKKEIPSYLNQNMVQGVWETNELSIDIHAFSEWLLLKLKEFSTVELLLNEHIDELTKKSFGYRVSTTSAGKVNFYDAEVVVNCTWESRLALDKKLGFEPQHAWLYRLKHAVHAKLPKSLASIPSMTFVLGPYGDVVNFKGQQKAYISWYPEGMRDSTKSMVTPKEWENISEGIIDNKKEKDIITKKMLLGFDAVIPGLSQSTEREIGAGIIYSRGTTEITDIKSELHQRFNVGIVIEDEGYFSIDTGKYTCAPLHAQQLASKI